MSKSFVKNCALRTILLNVSSAGSVLRIFWGKYFHDFVSASSSVSRETLSVNVGAELYGYPLL